MDFPEFVCEIEENEAIRRVQSGETEYFHFISSRYLPTINYMVSTFDIQSSDREDLIQEGLMALYGAVGVYDFTSASFATFASVCIKRGIISALRSMYKKGNIPQSLITSIDEVSLVYDSDPENTFINKEDFIRFSDKIKLTLSSFEYCVLAAYLKYGNYSEVAQDQNVTVKEVNNALQRARKKIRKINRQHL